MQKSFRCKVSAAVNNVPVIEKDHYYVERVLNHEMGPNEYADIKVV